LFYCITYYIDRGKPDSGGIVGEEAIGAGKMTGEGISLMLARHVAGYPSAALPAATASAAARALLDGIGVMLAASGTSSDVAPFVTLARAGRGAAPILGVGTCTTPALAALANGAMAHALDFEDAFDAAPCHPNAALLPAVLALAATRPDISGRDLLAAIAIGCDLVCRLGLALERPMEAGGWYPPPILGAFGAAAAAARLCRLDARQVLDAFSLMLCQVSTPGEIKHSRDTVIRAVREAFPAQAAVQAATLAAAGVRGFDAPFEGENGFYRLFAGGAFDRAALEDGLGERFWIERLTFKRWPACRGTHAYIEAVQRLTAAHRFAPGDIVEIVAAGGPVQRMLVEPADRKAAPSTAIDAKFSIPYTIAATLLDGDIGLDSFTPAALSRTAARRLGAQVRFHQVPGWGRAQAASGGVTIVLADGRRLQSTIDTALGHPDRPLDDAALIAKFVACAGRAARPFAESDAHDLATTILSIGEAADCRAFYRRLAA
jgi:2-methylcitrate dehydratase PrpD